ncbi:MAG TPA: S8 family serine peptidase [Terriglobales bacterium]|nr:S8 family serine peptidase [Terriglobales bacterium]
MGASRRWLLMLAAALLPLAMASPAAAATRAADPGAPLTPADVARLSADASKRSIIVFRNQHPELPARAAGTAARAAAVESDQRAVKSELNQLHSSVRSFHTVSAVAATISQAEADRLAANSAVQAVVPDRFIARPAPRADLSGQIPEPSSGAATTAGTTQLQQVCPADPAKPLLEPEALQLTNTEFQAGAGVPAAHDLVDGTGVTVAFIADGLDINNPDLTRNGRSIVTDYQDFSGDGVNAVTGGGEAFGDAASIAAQGRQVYDLSTFVNPAHPLPPGCTIQIKGMAPGANLVALKAFGLGGAFDSTIIQAIDWAVEHDHVNVINESFGANPFPDDLNDPVQIANANAVAAGITVVASSGDAGFTNTIGNTAATSPVIGVGATTQLRLYRQVTGFGSQLSAGGWIDGNPSAFSSAGFTQIGPKTLDVLAPGDLGWALCSSNVAAFLNCTDNAGRPANIQVFGGTSESSPLVAGEAALVIEAYRNAHGGASPSPDLVKRIITSTAGDLGIPAQEQGAGLADALKAVQAALSIHDGSGAPAPQGSSLLLSRGSFESTAPAGSQRSFHVAVTNTGSSAQTVAASVRRLADDPIATDAGTVTLDPATAPTFIDSGGTAREFTLHQFTVPTGAERLDADIIWAALAQPASTVRETLFDPAGRFAMYSIPQGAGAGFGHVDVHDPMPGTWTAVLWSIRSGPAAYHGSVQFAFSSSVFEPFGRVSPSSRVLLPGETGTFTVTASTPAVAGDLAASLVLHASGGSQTSVPITLRALVPLGPAGGTFTGVLQGGNGRSATNAQMFSFQFDVRSGRPALNLALTLRDPNYRLTGFLVSPSGEPLDDQSTVVLNAAGQIAGFGQVMQFTLRKPQAGRWTAILRLSKGIDGTHLQEPFTGRISFDAARVTALGVPDSAGTVLKAGQPVTAAILVTNTGVATKDFFVDPRLNQVQVTPLLARGATNVPLPLGAVIPSFVVPPGTDRIIVAAQGSKPIDMSIQAGFGGPRREGTSLPGNFAIATDAAPQVAPGSWVALPEELGPFQGAAPAATANLAVVAETRVFDGAVTSSSGDVWQQTVNATAPYTPLTLAPGATGLITVVIMPSAPVGSVVRGSLEVSTFSPVTVSGDQVISIPYAYRVG